MDGKQLEKLEAWLDEERIAIDYAPINIQILFDQIQDIAWRYKKSLARATQQGGG